MSELVTEPPSIEQFQFLEELNNKHKLLLNQHMQQKDPLSLERSPELVEAERLLGLTAISLGYEIREVPPPSIKVTFIGGDYEVAYAVVYLVHRGCVQAFDGGYYNSNSKTWIDYIAPEWAVLQMYP